MCAVHKTCLGQIVYNANDRHLTEGVNTLIYENKSGSSGRWGPLNWMNWTSQELRSCDKVGNSRKGHVSGEQ